MEVHGRLSFQFVKGSQILTGLQNNTEVVRKHAEPCVAKGAEQRPNLARNVRVINAPAFTSDLIRIATADSTAIFLRSLHCLKLCVGYAELLLSTSITVAPQADGFIPLRCRPIITRGRSRQFSPAPRTRKLFRPMGRGGAPDTGFAAQFSVGGPLTLGAVEHKAWPHVFAFHAKNAIRHFFGGGLYTAALAIGDNAVDTPAVLTKQLYAINRTGLFIKTGQWHYLRATFARLSGGLIDVTLTIVCVLGFYARTAVRAQSVQVFWIHIKAGARFCSLALRAAFFGYNDFGQGVNLLQQGLALAGSRVPSTTFEPSLL